MSLSPATNYKKAMHRYASNCTVTVCMHKKEPPDVQVYNSSNSSPHYILLFMCCMNNCLDAYIWFWKEPQNRHSLLSNTKEQANHSPQFGNQPSSAVHSPIFLIYPPSAWSLGPITVFIRFISVWRLDDKLRGGLQMLNAWTQEGYSSNATDCIFYVWFLKDWWHECGGV